MPSPPEYRPPLDGYLPLLAELKSKVYSAQTRAATAVNRELVLLYWQIGRSILRAQKEQGWGAGVVDRLAQDLTGEFPAMRGFSRANLMHMRAFAAAWPAEENVQQVVGQLPWGHNLLLLRALKQSDLRAWYARKAVAHGWSRAVLDLQIESGLHEREGRTSNNFSRILPPEKSDLAASILKDPYNFDFLTLSGDAAERDLEQGLVDHVQQTLLELGTGFALVGRQVRLDVGGDEFWLDLLFYHLDLRCFVVVDLKARAFRPEFAGKLNFYLSAVDDRFRRPGDGPTLGLLLARGRNGAVVECALRDIVKPIAVADWTARLLETMPERLKAALPEREGDG